MATFRLLALLAAFLPVTAFALPSLPASNNPPDEVADIPVVMLVDIGSGRVLFARQPDLSFVPASVTKVMTAFVAFEEMRAGRLSADQTFTVREKTSQVWKGRGTSMYLRPGDKPTVHQLLRGIMTASANDASIVLAEGFAGSVPAFTYLMNDTARKLGMTKSRFNTPNGWPDRQKTYVSARDLVSLGSAMVHRYPDYYATYSGKHEFDWNGYKLYSHDPITGEVPGADGIKTGFTREAGYNFLGSAERGGRRLMMVLAGAKSGMQRRKAARKLIEWGFSQWSARPLFASGSRVGTARVQGGAQRSVGLTLDRPVYATFAPGRGERIAMRIAYEGPLEAPIAKGAHVADLILATGNAEASRIPLLATRAVAPAGPVHRLRNGLMSLWH